ncbi:MAG TPA: diaminopimelate decarboxylase [Vicinamibacteria bacterium]|nr:diaminopimelate decarboxylase [Vicinamibacteria bacterium]
MPGFERREGRLLCDGASLEEAAQRFGTPLYVYSRAEIENAYRDYDQAFTAVPHRICYALKANSSGAILRLLADLGAGADIVSGGELLAALRAGFAAERIVYSGVGKTEAEIAVGVAKGIGEFNAESEHEIRQIDRAAVAAGRRVRVTLRVNPDIDPKSHPYISTGLRENKFGVDIALAPEILHRASALPGIAVTGLQCHIGSQMVDLDPVEEAVRELAALSRRLLAEGLPLQSLDIGGGLGVDYDGAGAPDPQALAARVLPLLGGLGLTLLVEPGRSIVARAGGLLTRVLHLKDNRGKRFVIVDAGMNDLVRPSLYEAHHRVEPVLERPGPEQRVDVVGPVCETGDFLAQDRELPPVEVGDLLLVRDAGAYGFAMSSNYNLRPRAAEVLVEDGGIRLIRRRETFEDLVRTEVG